MNGWDKHRHLKIFISVAFFSFLNCRQGFFFLRSNHFSKISFAFFEDIKCVVVFHFQSVMNFFEAEKIILVEKVHRENLLSYTQYRSIAYTHAIGEKGMKIQFIFLWPRPFISTRSISFSYASSPPRTISSLFFYSHFDAILRRNFST